MIQQFACSAGSTFLPQEIQVFERFGKGWSKPS
jgi:hypothetical protein